MIYFILHKKKYVKIGYTSKGIEERMSVLQIGNPKKLKLWLCIDGDKEFERVWHCLFKVFLVRGEWFKFHNDLEWFIIRYLTDGWHSALRGLTDSRGGRVENNGEKFQGEKLPVYTPQSG